MFTHLLLVCAATPAALEACGSSAGSAGSPPRDASIDTTREAGRTSDAGVEADASLDSTTTPDDSAATDSAVADSPDDTVDAPPSIELCDAATVGAPYFPVLGDADSRCYYNVDVSCPALSTQGGTCYISPNDCLEMCTLDGSPFLNCEYASPACVFGKWSWEAGQPLSINCNLCPGTGRRPARLRRQARPRAATETGEYFAQAAHLEDASVHAFRRLQVELARHGAPRELIAAARRSARDEERHARSMSRLASRFGACTAPARVGRARERRLESLARENAVEGCVRETFGAAMATWQAAHAGDPAVRRAMTRIAIDETRHAALAWAVADWADRQLDARARARVRLRRRIAARQLARELPIRSPALRRAAGLPDTRQTRHLVNGLSELWA